MLTLRITRMAMAILFVAFIAVNFFVRDWEITLAAFAVIIVWIVLTVVQIYYLSRARRIFQSF